MNRMGIVDREEKQTNIKAIFIHIKAVFIWDVVRKLHFLEASPTKPLKVMSA